MSSPPPDRAPARWWRFQAPRWPPTRIRRSRTATGELNRQAALDERSHNLLERAVERFGLSARAITRVRRVARTVADLAGSDAIRAAHVAEALPYRVLDRPVD